METRKKPLSTLAVLGALMVVLVVAIGWGAVQSVVGPPTVTLRAERWNNGVVNVWHSIEGHDERYTNVRDGTQCRKLDNLRHRLEDGGPPLYFHRLDCNGVIGYVYWDQAR